MFVIMTLFILFTFYILPSHAMLEKNRVCSFFYEGGNFRVTVKKTGFMNLSQREENKIKQWIDSKPVSYEHKDVLERQILEFINASIIKNPDECLDAWNYRYENYLFRRFSISRFGNIFVTTEQHCKKIVQWLTDNQIKKPTHEKQRIKVLNRGDHFVLKAKDVSLYEKLANSQIRQEALHKHKLIAFLAIEKGRCKDLTQDSLSIAKLQFMFEPIKN